jgi:hypothetical protein
MQIAALTFNVGRGAIRNPDINGGNQRRIGKLRYPVFPPHDAPGSAAIAATPNTVHGQPKRQLKHPANLFLAGVLAADGRFGRGSTAFASG